MSSFNKTIWIYWKQGWNNAPEVAKICLKSWYKYNSDYSIVELDDFNMKKYFDIDEDFNLSISKPDIVAKSDIIRLGLLKNNGGLWVDSTCFCTKPLNLWLDEIMINFDFFAYNKHINSVLISSWFLSSTNNSYLINKWYEAVLQYWKNRSKKHTYFWVHELFSQEYNKDIHFKNLWDKTPKYSAFIGKDGPHFFVPYPQKLMRQTNENIKNYIDNNDCPVFKLTRHFMSKDSIYNSKSSINYLFKKHKLINPNFYA
jgi:hypothetical protein